MLRKLLNHVRRGTLGEALAQRGGQQSTGQRVRWYGTRSDSEGAVALAQRADHYLRRHAKGSWVLLVGDSGPLRTRLESLLRRRDVAFRSVDADGMRAFDSAHAAGLAMVLCTATQTRRITELGRIAADNAHLAAVPFEYVGGLDGERTLFEQRDQFRDTFFVAPQLIEPFSLYGLYEESLRRFEQMCGLRDFLDFSQCIRHVVRSGIPGDVAEFGSFRGHSGWLMARLLQEYRSDKNLYMFDMFEHFPAEEIGVDYFWSGTHTVNFDEVQGKFGGLDHVRFVKGDFTQTFETSDVRQLAMAYIDCDSLRATRYLIDTVLDRYLSPGGLVVIEDYGHPALLGSRLAVHEALDARADLFRFYSQFSGLYIAVKLTAGTTAPSV